MGTIGLVETTPLIAESCLSKTDDDTINFIARCMFIKEQK
jgi:hypothetical protein